MSSGERCLHHSKLNHSLDRSNYQILLCDLSVQIICVPITNQDIQFLSAFPVFFFALLVWFIVVVGTNIVNHYHFIPLIGNPDRNHKLWNIESTEEIYIQALLECSYI